MTSTPTPRAAIILAAGQGTRMKSPLPKVLHPVGGRAMLDHAIDAAEALGCERIVVVVGDHSPEVRAHVVKRLGEAAIAVQDPPIGTGHAVRCAEAALAGFTGQVVVTYGDVPLLKATDIEPVFAATQGVTVVGFEARDPTGYGRLLVDADGGLEAIVEHREASPDQLTVTACNSGVMAAPSALLFELLAEVRNDNAKGEYYLTDVVELARKRGEPTRVVFAGEDAVMGVNAQAELAVAEALFQKVQRETFLAAGVTMAAPETVHFSFDTQVGGGTTIEPYVVFGPGARIASGARIRSFSHIEGATVAAGAEVGPYARLRPGADLGQGAKVGNFVEVKNVRMGPGAKANHLSYLGDGEVGAEANIGAGVIFCNYDGFTKSRTVVGAGAFIGSNSALVAPLKIGSGAYVGSGSVITKDVHTDSLAVARSQLSERPKWAETFRDRNNRRKREGLERAVQGGDMVAATVLGTALIKGSLDLKDEIEGVEVLHRAFEAGHRPAGYALAKLSPELVGLDVHQRAALLEEAIRHGDVIATKIAVENRSLPVADDAILKGLLLADKSLEDWAGAFLREYTEKAIKSGDLEAIGLAMTRPEIGVDPRTTIIGILAAKGRSPRWVEEHLKSFSSSLISSVQAELGTSPE